jgi:hypothetical protein
MKFPWLKKRGGSGILEGGSTRESPEDPYTYYRASSSQELEIPLPRPEIRPEFADPSKSSIVIEKARKFPEIETINDNLPT